MANEELGLIGPGRETITVHMCSVISGIKQSPNAKLEQSIPSEENLDYFKTHGNIPKDTNLPEDFKKL